MNDFKSEYQLAVQDMDMLGMKEIHIDAFSVMDEGKHRRRMVKRMQRMTATTFSAVCVIFLCGFGTVKAAEYIENVIKVSEWGFESGDAVTMARNESEGGQAYAIEDKVELAPEDNSLMLMIEAPEGEFVNSSPAVDEADVPMESSGAKDSGAGQSKASESAMKQNGEAEPFMENVKEMSDMLPTSDLEERKRSYGEPAQTESATEDMVEEIPVKNYSSWEECWKNEDFIFPQPSISMRGMIITDIMVCGDWVMARYDGSGKVLWLERTDYRDTQGHASSKVFPGGVCNERSYTTPQGYTYTLIDSVKESEEELLQIHAAVTVGTYEAFIDFMGYTEEEAKKIMDSVDLSVYE